MSQILIEGGLKLPPSTEPGGKVCEVVLIRAGRSANRNYYPPSTLKKSRALFEGIRALARSDEDHIKDREHRVRDIVGWFDKVRFQDDALVADFHISEAAEWLRILIKDAWSQGHKDIVGFSLVAEGRGTVKKVRGEALRYIESIDRVNSVDVVVNPAAGGRVLKLVAAREENQEEREKMENLINLLEEKAPEFISGVDKQNVSESELLGLVGNAFDEFQGIENRLKAAQSRQLLRETLDKVELPRPIVRRIAQHFSEGNFSESELKSFIDQERDAYAQLTESGKVSGMGQTKYEVSMDERERTLKALDGFFKGADQEGVERFKSIREAYITITGDKFISGQLKEASNLHKFTEALQTSSWAQILGDSITRKMLSEYNSPDLAGWKKIVSDINPIANFRSNRRMRMGGYDTLPAVAESADYAALTSPGDEEATYSVSKRGGLETVTLEMIANDDVGAVRRIPRKLGRLAGVTLYRFVLDMLKDNATCTYDSTALFDATHNNLGATALSASSLLAAKIAVSQQAAYGTTTDILGVEPRTLLVPLDLQDTAYRLTTSPYIVGTASENGTEPNIHSSYGLETMVVPYWTDTNDWVLVCDPNSCPTIEIGFFNGQEEPELFVQDQPTVGSLFTADKITYKIRHIYGGTILDHRGMYKAVVA
ncbi:MAG: hypothetical protein ACE5GM_04970 [bacterium]